MDLYWIIFLFSDIITKEALILLHTDDRRLFEMEEALNKRNAVASLIDRVLVKILCRLPARSLCYCKCVCRSWNRLISDSDYRKVPPQTVTDFFYHSWPSKGHFTSFTGERPSLSFLRFPIDKLASRTVAAASSLAGALGLMDFAMSSQSGNPDMAGTAA